jgi:hypothetical protein
MAAAKAERALSWESEVLGHRLAPPLTPWDPQTHYAYSAPIQITSLFLSVCCKIKNHQVQKYIQ